MTRSSLAGVTAGDPLLPCVERPLRARESDWDSVLGKAVRTYVRPFSAVQVAAGLDKVRGAGSQT